MLWNCGDESGLIFGVAMVHSPQSEAVNTERRVAACRSYQSAEYAALVRVSSPFDAEKSCTQRRSIL
jgi:hypothetical protein